MDDQGTDRAGGSVTNSDAMSILRLIEKYSGKLTWYQLARSDAGIHLATSGSRLMEILGSLKDSRQIEEIEGPNPGQPYYVITDIGRSATAAEKN